MKKREEIEVKRRENYNEIGRLHLENIKLAREGYLLSDDKQWFTEEEEDFVIQKRPKIIEKQLIGRIHWNECFEDIDYPEGDKRREVWIERSEVVRVNGEWI